MYSFYLFLISSDSVRYILFLFFIAPIRPWNIPFKSLIFFKRSLVFPTLLFSSISLHCSLRKAFLSVLDILWNLQMGISSFLTLPLVSLFSAVCKASSGNPLAFLHFFFLGMLLITTSCTMSWTSIHSSLGNLFIRFNPLKSICHFCCIIIRDLILYFLQSKSELGNKVFLIWATVSSQSCFC